MLDSDLLEQALQLLGESLADGGFAYQAVAIGGGSLLLLGLISRATADIDLVALVEEGRYVKPTAVPAELAEAAAATARVLGIREDWINVGPADLLDFGLPAGFAQRTVLREYGGLRLYLAGRPDQISLKLYAAVDQGIDSKHFRDLVALDASSQELLDAARWTRSHDPSPGFRDELRKILVALGVEDAGRTL